MGLKYHEQRRSGNPFKIFVTIGNLVSSPGFPSPGKLKVDCLFPN